MQQQSPSAEKPDNSAAYGTSSNISIEPQGRPKRLDNEFGPTATSSSHSSVPLTPKQVASGTCTVRNLALASLSTPELHLASDPLFDTDDPSHRILPSRVNLDHGKTGRTTQIQAAPASVKRQCKKSTQLLSPQEHGRTSTGDAIPSSGLGAFTSLGAVMGSVQQEYVPKDVGCDEKICKNSAGITILRDVDGDGVRTSSSSTPEARRTGGNWFSRRTRKWSFTQRDEKVGDSKSAASVSNNGILLSRAPNGRDSKEKLASHAGAAASVFSAPRPSISSSLCDSISDFSAGRDNLSKFFSDLGTTSTISQMTASTESSQRSLDATSISLDRLRSARAYMIEELTKLSPAEMGRDQERIINLAKLPRNQVRESNDRALGESKEMLEFWQSIADGVLLCLLANRLMPNSVDRIDRREVDWVKADNISRFLRALRDYFNIKTKDLFHPLDLADATVDGLDKAVHTILVVQKSAKSLGMSVRSPSSPITPATVERVHSKRRSLIASPPQSPETMTCDLSGYSAEDFSWSPAGSPSKHNSSFGSKRGKLLTVQQHRQAAEAKLDRNVNNGAAHSVDAQTRSRRRRSGDLSGNGYSTGALRSKGPSITFAEGSFLSRSSLDEDPAASAVVGSALGGSYMRMPYRDRKMSESAVSLTGVAEEELEETSILNEVNANRMPCGKIDVSQDDVDGEPPHTPLAISRPPIVSSLTNSSQKRINQEICLSSGSGAIRSSLDVSASSDEFRTSITATNFSNAANSPMKQTPVRQHGARAGSALNSARDSLSPGGCVGLETPIISTRVPFPRSHPTNESAKVRHLSASLNGSSVESPSGVSPIGQPARRHLRHSSELHLPKTGMLGRADDMLSSPTPVTSSPFYNASEMLPTPRARLDLDVGSLYSSSATNLLSQEDVTTSLEKITRETSINPSSRHKLVLTEGGKNVTYQMGNCIGRGQFGSVYRALNLNSGQMVAVKRIKLEGRSEEEVTQLMNEVDLLKSLEHPSVVKYEGLVRGPHVVSIILEYVENGSLLHTLKAFGNFPEKLVASYVVKILEGLDYLHEKDVVHCDLKAANILTTKNGNVKLSDFGVSLNLKAMEKVKANDAIGTPNWMAPEVIELKGASTAADIWSLGCTIIELLTGKPPYGDMLAMSVLFRIVEDERPPIPKKCSQTLHDFLVQCFAKQPTQRPKAAQLFEHDWLKEIWDGHKELRPQDSVPFLRRISTDRRRVDVKTLHAAINEIAEPTADRLSEDARHRFDNFRSFSTPVGDAWLTESAAADSSNTSPSARRASHGDPPSLLHSPLATVPNSATASIGGPISDPSVPDLPSSYAWREDAGLSIVTNQEYRKDHSFVKSTFSKAVRCRICRESVRKHAVLCEECGLICHASCARDVSSGCDIRAQKTLLQQPQSSPGRNTSPTASISSANLSGISLAPTSEAPATTSLIPMSFKFPFSRSRRHSRTAEDLTTEESMRSMSTGVSVSEERQVVALSVPATDKEKDAPAEQASRRHRISLLPKSVLRARSPSPKPFKGVRLPDSAPASSGRHISVAAVRAGLKEARRASSISYGSLSGSSSLSSASHVAAAIYCQTSSESGDKGQQPGVGAISSKAKDRGKAVGRRQHRPAHSLSALSSPHLTPPDGSKSPIKGLLQDTNRRASVQDARRKVAEALRSSSSSGEQADAGAIARGQMAATATAAAVGSAAPSTSNDKRRSRKTSFGPSKSKSKDKDDCTVM